MCIRDSNETGRDITYISLKLLKFQMICDIIHGTLKNKTSIETRIKLYNTMAVPVLM